MKIKYIILIIILLMPFIHGEIIDGNTERHIVKQEGDIVTYNLISYASPIYMQDKTGTWKNYTDVTSFTTLINGSNKYYNITWYEKEVLIIPYIIEEEDKVKKAKKADLPLDWKNNIEKKEGKYHFYSEFTRESIVSDIEYHLITKNTECKADTKKNYIICDEQKIDLNDLLRYNYTISIADDKFKIIDLKCTECILDPSLSRSQGEGIIQEDIYVKATFPSDVTNFDADHIIVGKEGSSATINAYLGFNFSSISPLYSISDFTLNIDSFTSFGGSTDVDFYYCNDSNLFDETTITWNTQSTQVTGCSFHSTYSNYIGTTGWKSINFTRNATSEVNDSKWFAIKLVPDSPGSNNQDQAYSKETGSAGSTYPYVSMTYNSVVPNSAPTMNSSTTVPLQIYYSQDIDGYCMGDDVDDDTLTYYYVWYVNGTLNRTGTDTGNSPAVQTLVDTIPSSYTQAGDNWTLSCRAYDGEYNSSWLNSSGSLISNFFFDDCTSADNVSMIMTIYNEQNVSHQLNATVLIEGTFWFIDAPTDTKEFHLSMEGNSTYQMCMFPDNTTVQADIYLKQTTEDGYTHRYYLYNQTFTTNGSIYNLSLYNFNTTTEVSNLKLTTRNKLNYNLYPNVVAKLQRDYIEEGVWRTVQMDQSGDYGNMIFHIIEESEDYRLFFYDTNNCLLDYTSSMKLLCESDLCEVTMMLEPCGALINESDLEVNISYDNSTGLVTVSWMDYATRITSIRSVVSKESFTGNYNICYNNTASTSGIHNCDITGHTGLIYVRVLATIDGVEQAESSRIIDVRSNILAIDIGEREGAFWTFGIMVTIIMFGIFSPVGAIMAMVFGLIVSYFLGTMSAVTVPFIALSCVIAIAIGLKVRT